MMEDKDKILDEIFGNDPLGLLDVKIKTSNIKTGDERLLNSFYEINDFIDKYQRVPKPDLNNISEYQLYSRLKNLREDKNKMMVLEPEDKYNILKTEKKEINSLDDILNDDLLGIFDEDEETKSLFDFKHTPREIERAETDFVARRKPCKKFDGYKTMFENIHDDLRNGKRKIIDFKLGDLKENSFYIHNGLVFFLEKINITKLGHYREDGTRVRTDGRTRCIFENGTESNMLMRSVEKILYANGKSITENQDNVINDFTNNFNNISEADKESGYIYILRSISTDPKINSIQNLYKIGYSTTIVEDRIKNAEKETTYLMAAVKIVAVYKTYNMNTQKFEQLLHNFFGKVCLNIDIYDQKGIRITPREWFITPIQIIEQAIELIISGEIIHYRYDYQTDSIIKK